MNTKKITTILGGVDLVHFDESQISITEIAEGSNCPLTDLRHLPKISCDIALLPHWKLQIRRFTFGYFCLKF